MVGQTGSGEADAGGHGHLGERHGDAASRDVVRTLHQPCVDELADDRCGRRHRRQIHRRKSAAATVALGLRPLRPGELRIGGADQHEPATVDESHARRAADQVLDHAEQADHGCRIDVTAPALVVQTDVAADARDAEGEQSLGHAVDRPGQLPHDLGMFRVAEVQAVDHRQRLGSDHGQVHHRLADRHQSADVRVDSAPQVVAVGRDRQSASGVRAGRRVFEAQHGGIAPRSHDGVEEQHVVVLRGHPRRVGQHRQQRVASLGRSRQVVRRIGTTLRQVEWFAERTVVERGVLFEGLGRHVSEHGAALGVEHPQAAGVGDDADDVRTDLPAGGDGEHLVQLGRRHDRQHALL